MYTVNIDVSDLLKFTRVELPQAVKQGFIELSERMQEMAPPIIQEVFQVNLSQEPNFPNDYASHLLETAPALVPISLTRSGAYRFIITVDMDALGGTPELEQATHYHAALEGGGRVEELPYANEPLAYDALDRWEWFQENVQGKGLEDVTHAARVKYWMSIRKAPEWQFLQDGEPYMNVGPHRVLEDITEALYVRGQELAFIILSQYAQSAANKVSSRVVRVTDDLFYVPAGRGSRWRGRTGFIPKPSFVLEDFN